jgi:hypothetical protein
MTVKEMIRAFGSMTGQLRDRNPLDTNDILYFLNRAQEKFVRDHFDITPRSPFPFATNQRVEDDLSTVYIKDHTISTTYGGNSTAYNNMYSDVAEYPDDLMFLVSARSKNHFNWKGVDFNISSNNKRVVSNDYSERLANIRIVEPSEIYSLLSDPFTTTKNERPLADHNDRRLNVFTDDKFVVDTVMINYIKTPREIEFGTTPVESELPQSTHREIVELSVQLLAQFHNQSQE